MSAAVVSAKTDGLQVYHRGRLPIVNKQMRLLCAVVWRKCWRNSLRFKVYLSAMKGALSLLLLLLICA